METASRTALWLLLGGWVGSWALFGLVVAPTAFRILPSTQIAGQLVGPVLTALHLYGGLAGVALALLARGLGRRPLLVALPLLMGAICLASHFGISLPLDEIRERLTMLGSSGGDMPYAYAEGEIDFSSPGMRAMASEAIFEKPANRLTLLTPTSN